MELVETITKRIKSNRSILFNEDDEVLSSLVQLINDQPHKVIILWSLQLCKETAEVLSGKYRFDQTANEAIEICQKWISGEVKMPEAKKAILKCHNKAKTIASLEDIALYHAIGQGLSVIHTPKHALGYPLYQLTAIIRKYGIKEGEPLVKQRIEYFIEGLAYWSQHYKEYEGKWADFIEK